MKTAFLTFEQFHGKRDIGSSRIRAQWIIDQWGNTGDDFGEAELYQFGKKYDCIIFQKVYWPEYAREFDGIKILDICDADWLHWNCRMVEMIQEVDAITCSSIEIAKFIVNITDKPVAFIPDRIQTQKLSARKVHEGPIKKVAWFGYIENCMMLDSAIPFIAKHNLELIVIANKPYTLPTGYQGKVKVKNYAWSENTVQNDICKADIVINPKAKIGRWKYKSDNKTTFSWAIGMPVAHDDRELLALMDPETRRIEADRLFTLAMDNYDVKESVSELKSVIMDVVNSKK